MAKQGGNRPQRTNTQAKPVSGPGALSQRTDMMTASNPNVYGDRKSIEATMSGAPMAKQAAVPRQNITGLFAPTERPTEPVTSGNPMGPGAGPEGLNLPNRSFNVTQVLSRLAQSDPTGEIEMILQDLNNRGIV
jgi:hypothetical protein